MMHNRVISAVGNQSASGDPQQHKHDMNDKLIRAAGGFAAGKTLGMSEEETLAMMSRQLRRQQRADSNVTMSDVARQFAQAGNSLSDVSESAEIKGVGYADDAFSDPFGQSQDEFQEFGGSGADAGKAREEKIGLGMISREDMSESELMDDIDRRERPQSGQAGVREALTRLERASGEQQGIKSFIGRLISGDNRSNAAVIGRMEDSLDYGPAQKGAEKALASELVNRDNARFSGRRAGYSNVKAQIEAEQIGERLYAPHQPGAITGSMVADESLRRISASNAAFPEAGFNSEGIAFDPATGNPIGQQGPVYQTSNTADTAQTLNAPSSATARSWMVEQQPEYRAGGRAFGDYQQTDITGATTLFADRLRQVEGFENISPSVRGVDEVQRAADMMIAQGPPGKAKNFFTREPVEGPGGKVSLKNVKQGTPDIRGVLNALRYTPAESTQLANALYQLEVAKSTEINQQGKQQYFTRQGPGGTLTPTGFGGTTSGQPDAITSGGAGVFFGSPEAIDPRDGQASVARVRPGQQIEGRDIGTAFRGLSDPGARQPFIGQVEGESPRVNRYNTTGQTSPEGIARVLREKEEGFSQKTGKPVDQGALRGKVTKAVLAQERHNRDEKKRKARQEQIREYTPVSVRRFRG